MAMMDAIWEANQQNAVRVACAASVAAEEFATMVAKEAATDAATEVAAALEMTTSEQADAHAAMEEQEAGALAVAGTADDRLTADAARMAARQH
jgi:F0F1-type ATP synthase gamma subunit